MKEIEPIHSGNYETWFLLFADGELSDVQKQMVIDFIQQHPHLQKVFDALAKTISKADNIQFENKEKLFRVSDETLLLVTDGELSEEDAGWIETALNKDVQNRIDDLKKAYNQIDKSIIFEGKEKLYRQPKVVPVFKLWQRAAAAAVALIAVSAWFLMSKNKTAAPNMAVTDVQKDAPIRQQANKDTEIISSKQNVNEFVANNNSAENKKAENNSFNKIKTTKNAEKANTVLMAKTINPKINNKTAASVMDNGTDIKKVVIPANQNKDIAVANSFKNNAVTLTTPPENVAVASGQTINDNAIDNNGVAFASNINAEGKKKKSFFKHIGEGIKNRALDILTDGGDNINVAGFAVNVSR